MPVTGSCMKVLPRRVNPGFEKGGGVRSSVAPPGSKTGTLGVCRGPERQKVVRKDFDLLLEYMW